MDTNMPFGHGFYQGYRNGMNTPMPMYTSQDPSLYVNTIPQVPYHQSASMVSPFSHDMSHKRFKSAGHMVLYNGSMNLLHQHDQGTIHSVQPFGQGQQLPLVQLHQSANTYPLQRTPSPRSLTPTGRRALEAMLSLRVLQRTFAEETQPRAVRYNVHGMPPNSVADSVELQAMGQQQSGASSVVELEGPLNHSLFKFLDAPRSDMNLALFKLLQTGSNGDLQLIVANEYFLVHQCLIVTRSGGYLPPANKEEHLSVCKEAVVYFLRYVYLDTYPSTRNSEQRKLLESCVFLKNIAELSVKFKMGTLLQWTENILSAQINVGNVAKVLECAFAYNLARLKMMCMHKIACCKQVMETDSWKFLKSQYPFHCLDVLEYISAHEKELLQFTNTNAPSGNVEEEDGCIISPPARKYRTRSRSQAHPPSKSPSPKVQRKQPEPKFDIRLEKYTLANGTTVTFVNE